MAKIPCSQCRGPRVRSLVRKLIAYFKMNDLEKLKLNILQDIFSCITVMSGNTVYKESEVAQSCPILCDPEIGRAHV